MATSAAAYCYSASLMSCAQLQALGCRGMPGAAACILRKPAKALSMHSMQE